MPKDPARAVGGGKVCGAQFCNLRLGYQEPAIEFDGKVYHLHCWSKVGWKQIKVEPSDNLRFQQMAREHAQ